MASPISIIATATNNAGGALGGLVNSITGVSRAVGVAQRDFNNWQSQVRSAEATVNDLRTRLDTLRSMGVQPNSQAFRDLAAQLGTAEANLRLMRAGASEAEQRLRAAEAAATGTTRAFQTMGAAGMALIGTVTALTAVVAGLTLGGFAVAIKGAADFEHTIGGVKAAASPTTEELRQMRVEAMRIGPAFGKSAGETIDAMGELAKSGMSMADVLGGGTEAVVALATAGGEAITPMAELLSKSLSLFRETGLTATNAADLIAKTANASAIGIGQFGFSLAAVGPVAAQAGLDFEQMSTAIGILGNNALVGSDAGTSLKTMLLALTAPSSTATKTMKALGISTFDAGGNMKDFRTILGDIEVAMSDLTDQERAGALKNMFGTDAIRAANILLKEGVQGWDDFMESMRLAPSVTDQANTRMGTFTGTLDRLKASFHNLVILAGTPFIGVLQVILGKINGLVSGFDIGRADAMSNALKGLLSVSDPEKRIGFYNELADAIGNPRLAEGIAIVTSGLAGLWQAITGDWEGGSARVRDAISQLTTKFDVKEIGANVKAQISTVFDAVGEFVAENQPMIQAELAKWTEELWKWVQPAVEPLMVEVGNLINKTVDKFAEEMPPKIVTALGKTTAAFVTWLGTGLTPAVLNQIGKEKDIIINALVTLDFSKVGEAWFASIVAGLAKAALGFNPLGFVMNAGMNASGDLGTAAGKAYLDATKPVYGPEKPGTNAEGTDYWRGGLTWLGEQGPELVDLPGGSQVFSHQRSMDMMSQAMQTVNLGDFNLNMPVSPMGGQGMNARQMVAQLLPLLEDMLLERLNGALELSRSQVNPA